MKNTHLVGLLVVLVLLIVGFAYWNGMPNEAGDGAPNDTSQNEISQEEPAAENNTVSETQTGATIVTYTEVGFAPESVTIKAGETVRFENKSGSPFWPASGNHPTHEEYSGTSQHEHCHEGHGEGDAFDACRPIPSGEAYSFTFTKKGEWSYHNHFQASHEGVVIVK